MACALLQDSGILYLDGIQFDVFYDDDSIFYDDNSTQWQVDMLCCWCSWSNSRLLWIFLAQGWQVYANCLMGQFLALEDVNICLFLLSFYLIVWHVSLHKVSWLIKKRLMCLQVLYMLKGSNQPSSIDCQTIGYFNMCLYVLMSWGSVGVRKWEHQRQAKDARLLGRRTWEHQTQPLDPCLPSLCVVLSHEFLEVTIHTLIADIPKHGPRFLLANKYDVSNLK